MTRYGAQYGPTSPSSASTCDLAEKTTFSEVDVLIVGAAFDGGTSHRSGTRHGSQAIRMTDYLGHDGSRASLALRTEGSMT